MEKEMARVKYELNEKINEQIRRADESLRKKFESSVRYMERNPRKLQKQMLKTVSQGEKKRLVFWDDSDYYALFCKALQCDVEARIKLLMFLCNPEKTNYTKRICQAANYPVRLEVWSYQRGYDGELPIKSAKVYLMWD